MKITIIGCGNAGSTVAADLSLKGHEVSLLKTSRALHNEHFEEMKKNSSIYICDKGEERVAKVKIYTSAKEALCGRDLIIVYIQTNYQEKLIKNIAQYLEDGQVVLLEPGYLATCYLIKNCDKDITVVEAESSPIDCRIVAPGHVKVLFKNVRNPVGVYPKSKQSHAKEILDQLGYPFEFTQNTIEAALHNPNLIVHTVGAIFSIPRIEYVAKNGGSYSMYREVFTPHVWNLVEALDAEKMNILECLGAPRIPYVEACKHRNSLDDSSNALDVFFDYANNSAPSGPDLPDSRYITEDVPEGLVLLESIGKMLNISTPVCSSLIDCASALLNRDFRQEGRTIERLDRDALSRVLNDK